MRKRMFIIGQPGIKREYVQAAVEAAQEFMRMFPDYKDDYPVQNISGWRDRDWRVDHIGYMHLSEQDRELCIPTSDNKFLVPYKSTEWAMAEAKRSAYTYGRPNHIDASKLLDLMDNDPTVQQIPQININIVKDDAFAIQSNGRPTNFVYGLGQYDHGMVLSTYRFEQRYGDNPAIMKEIVKTLVMHELGHIFGATFEGRHNSSDRDGYGDHCDCPNCVMRTDTKAKPDRLTYDRLGREEAGLSPFCQECMASIEIHLAHLRGKQKDISNAVNKFNYIRNHTIDYD